MRRSPPSGYHVGLDLRLPSQLFRESRTLCLAAPDTRRPRTHTLCSEEPDVAHPRLVGLITDRHITTRFVARVYHGTCLVRDVMTPLPLETVLPDADVSEIVRLMERAEVRRIPVVSDDGVLVGIVAEADLTAKLSPEESLRLRKRVNQYSAEPHIALSVR